MVKTGKRNKLEELGDKAYSSDDQAKPEKKKRTAPTNTSLLPPCKVCNEPAAGFHYGVNTCEACKGFFRRTLVRGGQYVCINGNGKCDVVQQASTTEKKRICPHCRHIKCLAAGMSTEAIKTGRYTHAKRTQDIMEYRQAVLNPSLSSDCISPSQCDTDVLHDPLSPSPSTSESGTAPFLASKSTSVVEPPAEIDLYLSRQSPQSALSIISASSALLELSAGAPRKEEDIVGLSYDKTYLPFNSTEEKDLSYTNLSPIQMNVAGLSAGSWDKSMSLLKTGLRTFGDTGHPPSLFKPSLETALSPTSVSSFLESMVTGEPTRHDEALSTSPASSLGATPVLSPVSGVSSLGQKDYASDYLTDEECKEMARHIVESHTRLILSSKYEMTTEEMLEKQKECFENCKARFETFGPMGQVSAQEYMEIFQSTGIDVDDRQGFVTVLSKMLDQNIREYINFVKTIPGFSSLTLGDQIKLIKDHRCEVGIIFQAVGYNPTLKVQTLPSGRCFCEHDLNKLSGEERTEIRFKCLNALQKLDLSDTERILLQCVVLFTLGQADVEEPEKVSAIQWKMMQCLRWQLRENGHPNPDRKLSAIINAFLRIKSFGMSFYEWLKSKPFEHYTQFKNNELLAEWFSNS